MVNAKSWRRGLRSVPDIDAIGISLSNGFEEKIIKPNKENKTKWEKESTRFLSSIFVYELSKLKTIIQILIIKTKTFIMIIKIKSIKQII